MGMFDWVRADGPEFVCSEGHALHDIQTKDLGATNGCATLKEGRFSFDNGGWHGWDSDYDPPDGPLTRVIEIYGHCEECPAFVQARTLNLAPYSVNLRVEIVNDAVVSVARTSETLAEFLVREPNETYMRGCYGPMSYAEALQLHRRPRVAS